MKFPFPAIAAAFRERRSVHQRIPDATEGDVQRIVRRDFAHEQFGTVMSVLDEYAKGGFRRECSRVQLAILKLANGDLEAVRRYFTAANRDYRDVLAAAEYPEYVRAGTRVRELPRKARQQIVNSDWEQYEQWLRR